MMRILVTDTGKRFENANMWLQGLQNLENGINLVYFWWNSQMD